MAQYQVRGPGGRLYDVEAPADATDAQIIGALRQRLAEETAPTTSAPPQEETDPLASYFEKYGREEEAGLGENILSGLGAGAVGLFETAALGAATLLDEGNETAARKVIQEAADALTPEGGNKEDISYKLAQGVGSILGFLPTALLGPAALPAAATLGVGAAAGEASERAREAGATEEERSTAALMAAPVGLLEVTPLGRFAKALKMPVVGETIDNLSDTVVGGITDRVGAGAMREISDRIGNAAATGGLEGAQEAAAEIAQNLIQQGVYDPEQEILGGVGEALAIGGGAGAIVQALVDTFAGRRARTPESERQAPEEPTAQESVTAPRQSDLFGDDVPAGTQMDMFAEELAAEQAVAPTEEAELPPASDRQIDMFGEELGLTPEQIAEAKEAARQGELFDGQAPSAQIEPRLPRPKTEQELIEEQDFEQIAQRRTKQAQQREAERVGRRNTFGDVLFALRNQERGIAEQELDRLDQMETAEIEAMLADDQRRAELVTRIGERNVAELERAREVGPELQAREAETAQQRRVEQRAASEAETAAGVEAATTQEVQAERREEALQDIIASDPEQTPDIRGTFQAVLQSGNLPTQLTETEERMIRRAEDLRAAEETVPRQIPATPEDTQLEELEAAVPERRRREEQLALEGIPSRRQEKRAQRRTASASRDVDRAPELPRREVTPELLDQLAIPKTAPIRRRTQGKNFNDPAIREDFAMFAGLPRTSATARSSINRELAQAPEEQLDLLGPRGGAPRVPRALPARAEEAVQDVKPRQPEPEPSGASVQASEPSPRRRQAEPAPERAARATTPQQERLEDTERDTTDAVAREGDERGALEEAPVAEKAPAKPKRKVTRRRAAETIQAVKPLPKAKTTRKPKADVEAPAPAKSTTTRKDVTVKDKPEVRETTTGRVAMTRASEADQKLREAQDKVVANPLSALFNYNFRKVGRAVAKDTDKTTVASLLERVADPIKSKLNKKEPKNAARFYFGKKSRIEDTIELIAHDLAFGGIGKSSYQATTRGNLGQLAELEDVTSEAENAFFEGLGNAEVARAAQSWIVGNMSPAVTKKLQQRASHYAEMALNIDNMKGRDLVAEERELDAKRADLQKQVQKQVTKEPEKVDKQVTRQLEQAFGEEGILDEGATSYIDILDKLARLRDGLDLPKDAVAASSLPLHPEVSIALEAGNLGKALQYIASTTQNNRVRNAAIKLAGVVGDTKVEVVENLDEAGNFDPKTNTIRLDAEAGMNVHTVLHEMTHAAVSATLANKSHPVTKQLTKLFESVKDKLDTAYGATNLDEFVSEAMSNPEFRTKLASIVSKGDAFTALDRFTSAVMNFLRRLFGASTKPVSDGTVDRKLSDLDRMIENIMAPAPESRNADILPLTKGGAKQIGEFADGVATSVNRSSRAIRDAVSRDGFATSVVNFLKSAGGPNSDKLRRGALMTLPSQALFVDVLGKLKITEGARMHELLEEQEGAINIANKQLDATLNAIIKWQKGNKNNRKAFDDVVYESTLAKIDPTKSIDKYKGRETEYRAIKSLYDQLDAEGKALYVELRDSYKRQYEKLKDVINRRIDGMVNEDTGKPITEAERKTLKEKVFGKLLEQGRIEPYFPLTRKGDYWLEYSIESVGIDGEPTTEPVKRAFESKGQRNAAIAELANDPTTVKINGEFKYETTDDKKKLNFSNAPPTSFVGQTLKILKTNGVDPKVQQEFLEMFIDTLPETAFAKSLKSREGTLGFDRDAVGAFRDKAYDLSRQVVRLEYAQKIRTQLTNIDNQINPESPELRIEGVSRASLAKVIREETESRAEFAINPPNTFWARFARGANRFAFMGTLGFNVSSAIVNLFQIPMVVVPFMAGKTSYKDALQHTGTAMKFVFGSGTEESVMVGKRQNKTKGFMPSMDNYYTVTEDGTLIMRDDIELTDKQKEFAEEMLPLVQTSMRRGLLNRSFFFDSLGLEQSGKDNTVLERVQAVGAMPFHLGERMNRQVSLVATYLNEKQYLKAQNPNISEADLQAQAVENALYETQQTNGGSVLATAPSITQNSLGRVAMMYKTYGIQMYYTQMKAGLAALNKQDLTPEQRRVARRQFIGTQLSVLALSGVQGLTITGMALALTNALFLEDDEPDAETMLRTYIGEGLYKGGVNELLATLGAEVDVASRIGLSNLILQTNRYNFDPSMEKTIVSTLGGPFYGYASSIGRGYEQMMDGEFQRGVESALPAAFRNMLKAGRFADEGALTKRKDPIMDDLGVGEIAGKFFGFQPAEYTLNQERNQVLKKIEKSVNEKRTRIMKEFYIATRMGDSEGRREAMKELLKFNRKYPRVAIGTDSLMRSLKQHRETSINMYNGVTLSQRLRADLAEIGDAFDQGPQFFE